VTLQLQLSAIGKRYRYEWIFRKLDGTLQSGESYAVLGPNGCGKSTLLRILCAHLSPSEGNIIFFDTSEKEKKTLDSDNLYQYLSFAAPYVELIEELTLSEAIDFHQKLQPFQQQLSTADLIEILGFEKSKQKEVRFFSSGMKQRLKLALACCADTPLLFLDVSKKMILPSDGLK
jgi:ABC-type multidrug transport system ATPase subunit